MGLGIFPGMLQLLAVFALAAFGGEPSAVTPSADSGTPILVATPSATPAASLEEANSLDRGNRADPSTQLLYSSLGGGLGIVGGGFVGGAVGAALSSESDGWAAIGNVILGVGVGVLVGGTTGATWGAVAARPPQKDRSFVPTALGGLGGLLLGFVAGTAAYNAIGADNDLAATVCVLVIPALGAGAGATIVDQKTTPRRISGLPSNSSLSLAPWMPRKGMVGLRATVPTGF